MDDNSSREALKEAWEAAKAKERRIVREQQSEISIDEPSPVGVPEAVPVSAGGLPIRQLLGIAGSLMLVIGVFCPLVSVPLVGDLNYFRNGEGDGVLVLIVGAGSLILTLTKHYRGLLICGFLTLFILGFTYVNFKSKLADLNENAPGGEFAKAISDSLIQSIQIQWGAAVIVLGATLLIAAALVKSSTKLRD